MRSTGRKSWPVVLPRIGEHKNEALGFDLRGLSGESGLGNRPSFENSERT